MVSAIGGALSWSMMGTTGLLVFLGWRIASYFKVMTWVFWAYELLDDASEAMEDMAAARDSAIEMLKDGSLELPIMVTTCVLLLLIHAWSGLGPRRRRHRSSSSAGGDASDSEGSSKSDEAEEGHSLEDSGDEVSELKQMVADLGKQMSMGSRVEMTAHVNPSVGESAKNQAPASSSPSPSPSQLDRLLGRLEEFEKQLREDRASPGPNRPASPTSPKVIRGEVVSPCSTSPATSGSPWIDVEPLKEALKDPRAAVLENALELQCPIDWALPGTCKERVAPQFLVKVISKYSSVRGFAQAFIREKELGENHVAKEVILLALAVDKLLHEDRNFMRSEGCEILCRRLYAIRRAFQDVRRADDWRQPKGAAANKWKTKVRWDLANEIDWRAITEDDSLLPGVEKDIQEQLQRKALLRRYITEPSSSPSLEDQ